MNISNKGDQIMKYSLFTLIQTKRRGTLQLETQ